MNTARALYACLTWLLLWGFAGGDMPLFWSRLGVTAALLVVLTAAALYLYPAEHRATDGVAFTTAQLRRLWLLSSTKAPPYADIQQLPSEPGTYAEGVRLKWALVPLALLIVFVIARFALGDGVPTWLADGLANFGSRDVVRVLGLLVLSTGVAFLSHALLQREWGTGNVVFLMGVTLGFASQQLSVFLVTVVVGGLFAFIAERVNILTTLVGSALWYTIFFLTIGFLA